MKKVSEYYQVKVQFEIENDKGKTQKVNENHLVNALSVTEAEAKIIKTLSDEGEHDFEVKGATQSKIIRVIK